MRTDEEMLRAAQANALIGGVIDACALEHGGLVPHVEAVVVVWEGTTPDGEGAAGVIAMTAEGECAPSGAALQMLGGAVKVIGALTGGDDPEEESEEGSREG
jgi:hypothetical protein